MYRNRLILLCALNCISLLCFAQFTVVHNFDMTDGAAPTSNLIFSGKTIYGSANGGGTYNNGVLYSVDTNGTNYTDLFDFNGSNGAGGWTIILHNGVIYGTCYDGGAKDSGCIYSFNLTTHVYTDLFDFSSATGGNMPLDGFVFLNNKLYGATDHGGASDNGGTIYSIDTNGAGFRILYSFSNTATGIHPYFMYCYGNKFYGVLKGQGVYGLGAMFSIDTNGTGYKDLYDYQYISNPLNFLNGKIYSTTETGGDCNDGQLFSIDTNGSNFNLLFTSFCADTGIIPVSQVVFHNNRIIGVAAEGGVTTYGTLYSIDTDGNNLEVPANFTNFYQSGDIFYDSTSNTLYGTGEFGGSHNDGVIFKINNFIEGMNKITNNHGELTISPNPFHSFCTVSLKVQSQEDGSYQLELFDITGKKLLQPEFTGDTYQLSSQGITNGIYFIRLFDSKNQILGTSKIVLQ